MNVVADIEDTSRLEKFREEAKAWINANFPASLRSKLEEYYQNMPRYPYGPDWALWKERVRDKGWGTPGWPKEYGGGGLPTPEARIVLQSYTDCGAFNPMTGMGTTLLGPTLLEYGNDE
jgi:alkylation response protein AidB-like acyl-CoA dehydrogenase